MAVSVVKMFTTKLNKNFSISNINNFLYSNICNSIKEYGYIAAINRLITLREVSNRDI
jgi:hypothetical protein